MRDSADKLALTRNLSISFKTVVAEANRKQQFFDRWAPFYDCPFTSVLYQAVHAFVLTRVDLPHGSEVLDVGCGTGRFLDRLGHMFPTVRRVGVDLSEEMLQGARRSFREGRFGDRKRPIFVRASVEALPFGSNRFDAVFCSFSFLHYPEPENAIAEIARVLKPSGKFVWVDGRPPFWQEKLKVTLTPGGVRLYGKEAREELGRQAGLDCVGHTTVLGMVLMSEFVKE